MKFDVVSVGDASLDAILTLNEKEADFHHQQSEGSDEICLPFASKIPVARLDFSLGGNAANVAVGLTRLGLKTGLYSIQGDDEVGFLVRGKMKQEGIPEDFLCTDKGKTSYSTIINFRLERTILEKKHHRLYQVSPTLPATPFIYVSSLGPDYEAFFSDLASFAVKNKVKVGFNPAQPQLRSDFKTYESMVRAAHLIFLNKEEAGQMLKRNAEGRDDIKEMLAAIASYGPKYTVITDGKNGAYASDGQTFLYCAIFPVEVVEATGAGDSFAAGFMGAIMHGKPMNEAMKWGMINAAFVVGKVGAVAGLQTKGIIEKVIGENPKFGPVSV